ncbi:hypothetical protein CVO76_03705 [Arthrobacter agilis]|uniref:SseB protein N-terminal domain-containing protein n=1 Tax=Arthrobacter agilis TaxID=37921 RepID=A0A2L0UC69_9MICC|nr:hypothetical protein CVO76_03705 [Arthrobacter agilis]
MRVSVTRDGLELPDGVVPQLREFDVEEYTPLTTVLEGCGLPLSFVDGAGLWTVVAGRAESVVAVVRQVPRADGRGFLPEVLFALDRSCGELAAEDGVLRLAFRSTPGPLADVLAPARDGRLWRPSARGGAVDNTPVADAVARFSERPGQRTMIEVLRTCLSGELLMDVTGSDPSAPAVRSFAGSDGARALGVFTSQAELSRFLEGGPTAGPPQSLALPGVVALETALMDPAVERVYVDPAGPTCGLVRDDLAFALQGPPNALLRDVVVRQGSQQELFTAMLGESVLFLAESERDGRRELVTVPGEGTGSTGVHLAVFTSAAEVAAFDPEVSARASSTGWVAELVFGRRLGGMVIDPAGPSASIGAFQLWHILANPSLDRGTEHSGQERRTGA